MTEVVSFQPGGYRYLRAGFQFSSGIAAEPGFEIERIRFLEPLPIGEGFAAVEAHLRAIGRPSTAFAACELRSAEPFSEQAFHDFNRQYVRTLERWGIYSEERNPVVRTNVCPEHGKPKSPVLYAFSYTVPAPAAKRGSFIIAGGAEVRGGAAGASYAERTVRLGETSPDAMREKVRFVAELMERRLAALGFSWRDAVSTQAYTVHDIGAFVGELAARGACAGGLAWHYARPPVAGLEFEMDVRGAARAITL
ncbi:MAG: 2-amino-5-chloromuconate deaminase CnbZ [Betaproteobacteria bacterium]